MFPPGLSALVFPLALLVAEPAPAPAAAPAPAPRERVRFNADWRFTKGDPTWLAAQIDYAATKKWLLPSAAHLLGATAPRPARPTGNFGADLEFVLPGFDDTRWRRLDLPHDWGIEGPFQAELPGDTGKLPWAGIGWYRKTFEVPAADAGRRVLLEFDGAMAYSLVWLNGQFVGGWPYGYTSYQLDLTPYLKPGARNVLAVRLDNPPDSSRWYPGGGLYRNVWLTKTGPIHVAPWGVFVTTPRISDGSAVVSVQVVAENDGAEAAALTVRTELFALDAAGAPTGPALGAAESREVPLPARRSAASAQSIVLAAPRLWGVDHPHRYVAVTTLARGAAVLDRVETPFGIRTAGFDAERGFLLNGEVVPLRGVCLHHDLGALGTAVHARALVRQLELLRAMGCNAIRTSHNPPAPELLEACDRLGFVVMDEAFDAWAKGKTRHDYHQLFPDWHEQDLRALVRRDRNHPSVVLWSIGNEVIEQWGDDGQEGWRLAARLASLVREEDRTRPVTGAFNGGHAGFNGFQHALDVMGYNYRIETYAAFRAGNPAVPLLGSETASTLSTRGAYFFPFSDDKLDPAARTDFQISSYDLTATEWATTPEDEWRAADAVPGYAGEFVWTGFDYLGEPTPYGGDATVLPNFSDPARRARAAAELAAVGRIAVPARSSYFGIVDLAGFPKDRYYLYQSRWRPDLPMAHLLPHWTWPGREGAVTPVHVYTSGDEAELFLNGRSLGRKQKAPGQHRLRWDDVRYEPGEIKVITSKGGQPWAEATQRTAGAPARLAVAADRAALRADGVDLAYVSVALTDDAGTLAPQATNAVRFTLEGPGDLVATDNGDPTSFASFQAPERSAFHGRALAIVRTRAGQPGRIVIRAASEGLVSAEVACVSSAP